MSLRTQGSTLFSAILILVATTVVVQLWLLTFSMETMLSGQFGTLVPAALASTALLLVNAGLMRYVFRFDREAQKDLELPDLPLWMEPHLHLKMDHSLFGPSRVTLVASFL